MSAVSYRAAYVHAYDRTTLFFRDFIGPEDLAHAIHLATKALQDGERLLSVNRLGEGDMRA